MHAGDNRALAWATLASLALHAVLVVAWPRVQERLRPAPSPPIVSRLVQPPVPEPEPPRAGVPPQPRPAQPKPPAEKRPRFEKPAPNAVQPVREPAPAPKEEIVQPAPPNPAVAPAPAPAPPVAAIPAPSQAPQPSIDVASTIAQYRLQVLSAARRLKSRYPDLARENNWSGSVVVALAVGADGAPEIRVKSGSGHAPLDQQASEMFRQAARAVPVPPALQGRAFSVELKAVYGLVD